MMAAPVAYAAAVLRTTPLFADLSPAELEEMAWAVQPFTCEAGERLFAQGAPAEDMYCLAGGRVGISVRLPGTEEVQLATLGPGEVLGEMALLGHGSRSASATALAPCTGYRLRRRAFEVLRAAHRPGALKLL
jgi:CRP/FNR family transcriptional regulator, cyclic AMP receptor protein